ncbi:MAG TPA: YitT family protein, partial [Bacilli bacterium]
NIGFLYLIFNVPILAFGWLLIGRRFVLLSILCVICTTFFMQWIPTYQIINDPILASVFGGVIVGVGTGIALRGGGSTGGFDIVGSIVTRKSDFPLGMVLFGLNALVILALGYPDNWDAALYSMISIYASGKVVDTIHVRHVKITCFIITNRTQELLEVLLKLPHGVTIVKTEGAFTHAERDMLMTVTTRYELANLRKLIREVDPKAWVNMVETVGVMGDFRRP